MGDILTSPAQYGDTDNTLLLKLATAAQDLADNPQTPTTAVLYTSQTLTSAQAGQAFTNLSPAAGADSSIYLSANASNRGFGFKDAGGNIVGRMSHFHEHGGAGHHELVLEFDQSIALAPLDNSETGTAIQLGGSGNADTIIYVNRKGDATGTVPTNTTSKIFLFGTTHWNSSLKYGAVGLQASSDTSGNLTLALTNDTTHGWADGISASLRIPAGTAAKPSLLLGSGTTGLYQLEADCLALQSKDGGLVVTLGQASQGAAVMYLGGAGILQTGYVDSVFGCLRLYYAGCGAGVVGAAEWYLNSNGAKIASILGTGIRVEDTMNLSFATGTGTKIGTATGQKIGFWNVNPVAQQVLATGSSTDNVITLLQTLGLCRQS